MVQTDMTCHFCGQDVPEESRFCTKCGNAIDLQAQGSPPVDQGASRTTLREEMNMPILIGMTILLGLAVIFPPWETPSHASPAFLGFHFFLSPPQTSSGPGVVSRLLLTIALITIATGGFYFSWLFRKRQ